MKSNKCFILFAALFLLCLEPVASAQLSGTVFQRISRISNFEFGVLNCGRPWGDTPSGFWPRGSFHMRPYNYGGPFMFLAKKNGQYLASDAGFFSNSSVFWDMVPGRIDDPRAGYDNIYRGPGWRYVDDPDYIVYSSLDYDSTGADISGSNFNDWPLRRVNGARKYVADPLERRNYSPVYVSDEDMFCVFKDTDTRSHPFYTGPNGGKNVPIGIEIQHYVYTWGSGIAHDIAVFQYKIINKSGERLDSCFFAFGPDLDIGRAGLGTTNDLEVPHTVEIFNLDPSRRLSYTKPKPGNWSRQWNATPFPPTVGFPLLETPQGYSGAQIGLTYAALYNEVRYYQIDSLHWGFLGSGSSTDSTMYHVFTHPQYYDPYNNPPSYEYNEGPVPITGPFPILPFDTATIAIAFIFSDSLPHLLLMDDFITRVYNSGFQRPSAPPPPKLSTQGLDRSVKLSWDNSSESATDPIIPDSLGKPFKGYRLLRAKAKEGPYVELARWTSDSGLVHEFLDRGTDIGGLKNNVRYYYQLLSFDEGAKLLKLDPMESKPLDGVNAQSVVPTTEPSNASSQESTGGLISGVLGDVSPPNLVPLTPTNFNNLISGRKLQVTLGATTDGVKYTLPITIKDTIAGRVTNAVLDPNLLVHGSASIAGIKQGKLVVHDIFGINAADVEVPYKFEQLSEPYHIAPTIISSSNADVPIIIDDSLKYTGINLYSPYTSASKEIIIEFTSSGIDTASILFQRYIPYLNIKVTDVSTNQLDTTWQLKTLGVRASSSTTYSGKINRYYLTGTLSNNEQWDFGNTFSMYQSKIAFDYPDRGVGSGKSGVAYQWGSGHRAGTKDFSVGDKVRLKWQGGVKAVFPNAAVITLEGPPPSRTTVTDAMMDKIRIVPNPFMVSHEAQRGTPRLYFNYLPEECTIRIYTIALDLVKTITHTKGSREEWDLQTEGGQLVASQMLYAYIAANNGKKVVKKFSVVVGK